MDLRDISNPILFVDHTINRAKIQLFSPLKSGQMTKVIRYQFKVNEFGKYEYIIYKADEKYCTIID